MRRERGLTLIEVLVATALIGVFFASVYSMVAATVKIRNQIEDEATPAQLASVGARGLFGLYQGVPRTTYGADQVQVPSKITIFRGPLTRAYRTPAALAAGVADTVYHEIAHHFGISDARLTELRGGR